MRGKLRKLADRGWLHKRPDGKLAGDTVDGDALVVQGVGLGVKEWRRERDVLQAAEHVLCVRFGSPSWVRQPATGDLDP
ncbi:hypothetical protein ACIOHE_00600 [Streptomyces sp. NPDC087851]|uniref:hypothetical protein n=1 Tax=Streptomyces sp. NPDC087851 TaxID=3365810 RepID=UPI00382A472B